MDEKKYQVFVSSTYTDLYVARKKIIETVLSLYHFPVGMEMFSADDSEQWDIIKETIEASDYYVIIIGQKYGSIASSGISYTEMEYDYAKELGVPVLAFIRNPDVGTTPEERERDFSKVQLLENFIQKAKANKMCDFWDSIDDLATKVAIALPKIMRRTPRVGWVRGNEVMSKEISIELAELSTENRKLREKVRMYESQLSSDAPMLKLTMIDSDLTFTLANRFEQSYPDPLTRADVPVEYKNFITEAQLQDYNYNLPDNKQVDSYNKKLFLHKCYLEHSLKVVPRIENTGKVVATDIYVEVELPDSLVALNSRNEDLFIREPKLEMPVSPIKNHERLNFSLNALAAIRNPSQRKSSARLELPVVGFSEDRIEKYIKKITPLNAPAWIDYGNGKVVLRTKKLIQSLSITFDEVVLIPIKAGVGNINFKIICEELKEPIIFSHRVVVSE
ncbi:DUF4062 domain-containing protein [Enterobacter ludwigii]|uniref:DUF4062 domain-containing protein n=1 Tax=Enterobacter ludwigii TaxID=299767 RepID=UPI001BDFBF4E|nr:DUF4062 domain-containing protein [Enterobacter ludwigii]MBT1848404.1 DUF4062 domain-containing protein [Enterobacter ludwigii]